MWKIHQLCHATDFQSLMYPCFVVCQIIGIFPYKINASTVETSKLRYILPTLLFCAVCINELQILHEITTKTTANFGVLTHILEGISFFTLGGFIVTITYILSSPRMHVLQAMLEISLILPPKSYQKLSKWIHVKDILGTILLLTQEWIFYIKMEYTSPPVLSIYISLVIFHMDMQYINYVCVLKTCFKKINNNLMNIQKMVNDKAYSPRLIYHTQKDQLLLIKVKILKNQHLIVSNTVQMLNRTFSLQLLITTTITFTEIIFEVYLLIIQLQNELPTIVYDSRDVFFLVAIGYTILKFILIVWACESNKNQAFEIGTTVHDVFNRTSDEQIKEELQLFSLQILHSKKTFSTKGLAVDATLLTAMTGSVTTYILILTQFMLMSRSCSGKIASNITQITF